MKKKFIVLILLVSALRISAYNARSSAPEDTVNLIIGTTLSEQDDVKSLRSKLENLSGVKILAYCSNLNVFIVRTYGVNHNTQEELLEYLQKAAGEITLYKKEGSFRDIISECTFSGEQDYKTLKELQR